MKPSALLALLLGWLLAGCASSPRPYAPTAVAPPAPPVLPGPLPATQQTLLPNGWKLSPVGQQVPLGDLPLNLVVSASGRLAAVINCGWGANSVQLLNPTSGAVLDEQIIKAGWVGLAFGPQEKMIYASGGQKNRIYCFRIEGQKLVPDSAIVLGEAWPKQKIGVAGLAVDARRQLLYAVTREDSALYTFDLRTRALVRRLPLGSEAYTAVLAPDGNALYVSLWGASAVAVYDPRRQRITARIPVESHPNDMLLSRDGRRLFVANANSNSVSVLDTRAGRVTETLVAALFPNAPAGSTPNGVALSADETQLFVANADNNCLAVFDVREPGKSTSLGFVPTGWYPTAVRTAGTTLLIANGKGSSSAPNSEDGPNPLKNGPRPTQYIAGLLRGSLTVLPTPDAATLGGFSAQVYANTPYTKAREQAPDVPAGNPVPQRVGQPSPIRHVFYIIKENRTYDQVLGDMPEGNGDKSLCLFGEDVTPNHHALAREFVLLDNFYADAEVSADGHNWSTAAYANDYVEKTWPSNYSGRGGSYDYEGGRGEVAVPKDGFIWDYCQRAGVSYRSYGEFVTQGKATVKALEGHVAADFPGYNLSILDVDREKIWERDFDKLVAAGQVPQFQVIRLPNDHTSGARLGARTPLAYAGDNDLALGRLIEHLSQSPVWKESVVMIVEDDAQNGPDHVDAHRTTAYVAGPHVRRGAVVHTMYSTAGMLRTMELILGLPPMSQYDAAARPMWECFTSTPDARPFVARPARVDLNAKNTALNRSSREAEKFDLSREDAAPDVPFNENIWRTIRGEHSIMPAPRRSSFVRVVAEKEDEDDD
ncbi:40-residue YVTN family beta-propeller repeat protein [Hymenobacter roseosalivarius DSM 11622]|uniref:40-residue YVTN family beta-propeller repeat protein n=1 Tax=Hymenobacter roseosalivarius DSM 11622 TaxID=645990 RepID=A0A1W1V4B8_9BACT|nr:bifunctional YncE family protein/alkaline phosphatase family protein [Hymenobacter roseosalivarius]SMB87861.1 40-residue YVTN family beta-propeller repeat protein [Hymenobacter roseosalivarius DSM 11622]